MTTRQPMTFVLVHGAFHGGWCWARLRERLQQLGHRVFTPSQTGLGDRSHLLSSQITMTTFVSDIVNLILNEELTDVVLVGHSFGSRTVVGVADLIPEKLRHLVFLDGGFPESGRSRLETMSAESRAARISAARESSGGLSVPAPPAEHFGLSDPDDIEWVGRRLTPQPFGVDTSALTLGNDIGNGLPCTYVRFTHPCFDGVERSAQFARTRPAWRYLELPGGHDAMITEPAALAALLLDTARLPGVRHAEPNAGATPSTPVPTRRDPAPETARS